jgi:hypothetical protein
MSSFWQWNEFNHAERNVPVFYEKFVKGKRVVEDYEFKIQDGLNLLQSDKGLFMDKTLILDIDLTLGQAGLVSYHRNYGCLLENKYSLNLAEVSRLVKLDKVKWFQNHNMLFFIRPYFKEFIEYCDRNFKEVIIWTLGNRLHSLDMQDLCKDITGKTWKAYCRDDAESNLKIVTKIGLDPSKTWMVDDDHRHYWEDPFDKSKNVNSGIKFFHTPTFNILHNPEYLYEGGGENFSDYLYEWGRNIEIYDDWFPFLIWNWNYMHGKGLSMTRFIRNDFKFVIDQK